LARAAEKLTHKEQQETDPFVGLMSPLADGLQRNWRILIGVSGVILLVAFAVAIGLTVSAHRSDKAADALGVALEAARKPVEVPPAGTLPPAVKDEESFPSETEKEQALAKGFEGVVSSFPGTVAARTAVLGLGDARYRLGKFAEANESYGEYLKLAPPEDTLRALAWIGEAYAALGQNKGDEALAATRHLVDEAPAAFGRDLGLWAQGKIAQELGKTADARKAFQQLKSEFPDTRLGREAAERLAALGEPPVAAPAAATPVVLPRAVHGTP